MPEKDILSYCFGIASKCEDGKDILMLDFDIKDYDFEKMINDLQLMQSSYSLSNMYIIESNNGYNIFSLDKISMEIYRKIDRFTRLVDSDFMKYGLKRGYFVLRMDKDKQFFDVLEHEGRYRKSNAHRLFFNFALNMEIKKDLLFDRSTRFDLIQYDSDKDGYFNDKC
jgi:hypothetical protein